MTTESTTIVRVTHRFAATPERVSAFTASTVAVYVPRAFPYSWVTDGSVVSSTPQFTPSILVERIPLKTTTTLASRMRSVPEWVLAAIGVVGVVLEVRPRARRTREGAVMGTDG